MPELEQASALRWVPRTAVSTGSTLANATGGWRRMRPVYANRRPPCHSGCPAGEPVADYLSLAGREALTQAWRSIMESNPFPAICGQICYHPCEEVCNRRFLDEPVAINKVERFLGQWGLEHAPSLGVAERRPEQVAVVGAGPAGLSCAYHLVRIGYGVTVLEQASQPGGMLRLGVPAYRLPRTVLEAEVAALERLGVSIKTGVAVGREVGLTELLHQGYSAVFVATGAHQAKRLDIPGESLHGVLEAISFLRGVNEGGVSKVGRRVVVIGGGNVAIDAARSAKRLGAEDVVVMYRRGRSEMPAHIVEVAGAELDGVRFQFGIHPVRVLGEGTVAGLECVRTTLAPREQQAATIPGSEFTLEADTAIVAVGQVATVPGDLAESGLHISQQGTLETDDGTFAAGPVGVFAGGDVATGPARLVDAIGAGKRGAQAIDAFIRGAQLSKESLPREAKFHELNMAYFNRETLGRQGLAQGLAPTDIASEAKRCLSCGVCNACGNCRLFCPDSAVLTTDEGYAIDYHHCKGCGICVEECPRAAIHMEEESLWRRL